uniref:Uncharacterized protein n=1 Tax=Eptatretus burgeri TaxID=7764 RepID=A0A8C4Q1I3_EPTBU
MMFSFVYQCPLPEVLRLLCLLSVTEGGLLPNDLRNLKNHLLQSYGTEQLLTLANLRRTGLLADQQPLETMASVESRMGKLVVDKTVSKAVGEKSTPLSRINLWFFVHHLGIYSENSQIQIPWD